ncbi:conserved hypothetical protein [Syntrophobacter sp. SbD1]|nr:conserved hypothetical protein [Syntrophobacter sp. SbD1]
MAYKQPQCALCPFDKSEKSCCKVDGKAPGYCPTLRNPELVRQSIDKGLSGADLEFARQACIQEGEGYCKEKVNGSVRPMKPRILEVIEFAKKMTYHKVALIFCVGLRREASIVHKIFDNHGLDVISIACKVGRVPKETLGLTEEQKIFPGNFESMCNPILQALLANSYGSQLNVLLGLCVGHDSLFLKNADAPSTVLAVKDRLLGHNPLAAINLSESYYNYLVEPAGKDDE